MASYNPELKSADNSKAANGEPAWQQAVSGRLSQASGSTGWDLPQLGIKGLQSFLKLRTRHKFNDRLSADLGVDIGAFNQAIIPRAALSYKLSAKDVDMGVLRATPSRLVLLRSWKVDLQRISFRLDGSAGVTYQGNPDFSVDFGDIKPKALVFVAAAVMLILGKPLTGTKPFGNLAYSMPKLGSDISGKGEAKLSVKRESLGGFNVSLKQLNAVLRI